jgi:transposase
VAERVVPNTVETAAQRFQRADGSYRFENRFRYRAGDRAEAERRLDAFLSALDRAGLPAFDAFAKGIRLWQDELLAYFDEPTTNRYAEGVINKVKVIKRRAYGIPTFTAFRQRVPLACG